MAVLGTGPDTVVLSNESDENLCSWLPLADHLTAAGYRVALWDYGAAAPVAAEAQARPAVAAAPTPAVAVVASPKPAAAKPVLAAGQRPGVTEILAWCRQHDAK